MSRIQNSLMQPKTLLEPAAFIGMAFLVGSTRLIEYFPGASTKGLVMSAGLAATTSCMYDQVIHNPDHHIMVTLMGKAIAIGLATVGSVYLAKPLSKQGVSLSFEAAAKLGVMQFVFAAIVAKVTEESELSRERRDFVLHLRKWMRLSEEDRTSKALELMNAGLPAISTEGNSINKKGFPNPQTNKDWEALTPAQLSWALEVNNPPNDAETQFFLFKLALSRGIEPSIFQIDDGVIAHLKGKESDIDLLYSYMKTHPQYFWAHNKEGRRKMTTQLFVGKAPLPKADSKLSPNHIAQINMTLLWTWGASISEQKKWAEVSAATRLIYVQRMLPNLDNQMKPILLEASQGLSSSWIADEITVHEIRRLNEHAAAVYHQIMTENKAAIKDQLSQEQMADFNLTFRKYRLPQI